MCEKTIDTLREEAQRLLTLEIGLLNRMKKAPGIFDQKTIDKDFIEVLEGEKTKLENLDMVLVVVGTMKVGKSTTINALVGSEIMPHRAEAMTALPTLIRHTPSQKEPSLKFNNHQSISRLMKEICVAIENFNNPEIITNLENDKDMKALIDLIRKNSKLEQCYEGSNAIFNVLKELNDLVRLSKELKIKFPFEDYNEVDQLPVIEVEFVHLPGFGQGKGRFTLLDTPGPNEYEQPKLRDIVEDQLKKATVVFAVLDYSGGLTTNASVEIQKNLEKIAEVDRERIYVLLNKFDQNKEQGPTKNYEAKSSIIRLMKDRICISEKSIFPVSSLKAYLTYRGKKLLSDNKLPNDKAWHDLAKNGKLPSDQVWLINFYAAIFGDGWDYTDIKDLDRVKSKADKAWEDSGFDACLETINNIHNDMAYHAIGSAADKLVYTAKQIKNFLIIGETGLTKDIKELQGHIENLQKDIDNTKIIQSEVKKKAEEMQKEMQEQIVNGTNSIKEGISYILGQYFREGKAIEELRFRELVSSQEKQSKDFPTFEKIGNNIIKFAQLMATGKKFDFDPKNPIIEFETHQKAEEFIENIQQSISDSNIFLVIENDIKGAIKQKLNLFQKDFKELLFSEAYKIIKDISERLEKDGFPIDFELPNTDNLVLNFPCDFDKLIPNNPTKKRLGGIWGTICWFFDSKKWGFEKGEKFLVDIEAISKETMESLDKTFDDLKKQIKNDDKKNTKNTIDNQLNENIEKYFDKINKEIEYIRDQFSTSIENNKKSADEKKKLINQFAILKSDVPDITTDSHKLKVRIQSI
jgi:RNA-binding protein YhbY